MIDEKIQQLKLLLASAVEAAYAESELFVKSDGKPRQGNEQMIVFRVGIYLHERLKNSAYAHLNLDCEYNKHGDNPKLRPNRSNMRPDLLIHSRGNDDHNVMVVEFAGWWKPSKNIQKDKDKLKELTGANASYKYHLGVLVKINKNNLPTYEYFRNGDVEKS